MSVSREEILIEYMGKYLAANGDALTQRTADAGCSETTIIDSALTQANDYWNDALVVFDSDTTTSALQSQTGYVIDWDLATNTLTLAYNLPATPAAGDTFRLVLDGKYQSSTQIDGLTVDSGPSNVTGVTIDRVAYTNGPGSGTLSYTSATTSLTWQSPDDESTGAAVDVSGSGSFTLYSDTEDDWITVTVVAGSLPGSNQNDTITLSRPEQLLIPDMRSAESEAKTCRYWCFAILNNNGSDAARFLRIHVPYPDGTATTLVDAVGTTASNSTATDASDWPTRSFWMYNSTKGDIRWVDRRDGNELYYFAAGSGTDRRGFSAVSWDAGDTIQPYPEIDVQVDEEDGYNQFVEDPASLSYPSLVPATRTASTIFNDDLAANTPLMIGIREPNPADSRGRDDVVNQIHVTWE